MDASFEMAYTVLLSRCLMEVKKLWIEHITFSATSILRRPVDVFLETNTRRTRLTFLTYTVWQDCLEKT